MQLIFHQCFLYINQIIVNRTTLSPVLLLSWKFTVISQQPILFASMILLVVNLPSAHPILPYSILSSGNSQYFLLLWSYYCSCKSAQCPPYPVLSSAHPIQYFHQPTANTYCLNVLICCKSAHPIPMYCHLPATNFSGLYDLICCISAHPIPCLQPCRHAWAHWSRRPDRQSGSAWRPSGHPSCPKKDLIIEIDHAAKHSLPLTRLTIGPSFLSQKGPNNRDRPTKHSLPLTRLTIGSSFLSQKGPNNRDRPTKHSLHLTRLTIGSSFLSQKEPNNKDRPTKHSLPLTKLTIRLSFLSQKGPEHINYCNKKIDQHSTFFLLLSWPTFPLSG